MVEKDMKKTGFSLIEILLAMLILSIFFLAAAKILTVKPKREYKHAVHGFYECYYDGSQLKSHEVLENYNKNVVNVSGDHCTYEPSKNLAFYNIIVIYPTSACEENDTDCHNKGAYVDIVPAINNELNLYPGSSKIISGTDEQDYSEETATLSKDDIVAYLNTIVKTQGNCKLLDIVSPSEDDDSADDVAHKGGIMIKW